ADDAVFVTYLTNLINAVYTRFEADFWQPGKFTRCSAAELRHYIQSSEIAVAWRRGSSHADPADVMGCVRLHMQVDDDGGSIGACGMLVCDPSFQGTGVGRALVEFVEERARAQGAKQMQVEVIVGDGWVHEFKERLAAWYERRGYRLLRTAEVRDDLPWLADILAKKAKVRVFRKRL
ncbi:hypothetical protein N656DRAFT_685931, partial [Canariomyces notabilis]